MEPPAQGTGYGLRSKMIVKRGAVFPYFISADLDEARSKHDPEYQPAKQNNDWHWSGTFWKRTHVDKRAKEDSQEAGFEQLNFPAIAIPFLPDMNKGHIKKP